MAVRIFTSDPNGPAVPGFSDLRGTFKVTYEGAVLSTGERNWHDDSDFFARVWDEASSSVIDVDYATTRGWTYANSASVDATPEVRAKAATFYAARALAGRLNRAADAARTPERGKMVRVVKGRKVPRGTEGEVIWVGEGRYYGPVPRYRSGSWSTAGPLRLGLRDADGTVHWTAASNVEVLNPEDYLPDYDALVAAADSDGRSYAGVAA